MLAVTETVLGANSDVGALRTVIVHRPGAECGAGPDAERQHDAFTTLLRSRGVEVLQLADLLVEALAHSGAARVHGVSAAVDSRRLGVSLAQHVSAYLRRLEPVPLARVLITGMTFGELGPHRGEPSLVRRMHDDTDAVVEPLPELVAARDSSFWIGPRMAITSLARPERVRETSLTDLIYAHHPRFLGVRRAYESRSTPVEGGDVLRAAPGVVAVGVSRRTPPAGAEALARSLFVDGLAHTVLAVPLVGPHARRSLATVCAMVDGGTAVMAAGAAESLSAFAIRQAGGGVEVGEPEPFVTAAARAMGIDRLVVIEQHGGAVDVLALAPGVVVTPAGGGRAAVDLAGAGVEVLALEFSALGRGPSAITCAAGRDPR